jgi:predicted site-specific integrase-resolvase
MSNDDTDKEENNVFITMREASRFSSVHPHTIRKYADAGKIKCFKTPTGQRRIHKGDLQKFCGSPRPVIQIPKNKKPRINFVYARVSSKEQLDNLHRQTQYVIERRPEYASYVVICDVASGINFNRKGLQKILDACIQGTIGELVVSHKDRLCRFAFDLLQCIVQKSGGKITVLDDDQDKSTEQELAEDLLSIVNMFSYPQMGKRRGRATCVENACGETEAYIATAQEA